MQLTANGGDGDDVLIGSAGNDTLTGGSRRRRADRRSGAGHPRRRTGQQRRHQRRHGPRRCRRSRSARPGHGVDLRRAGRRPGRDADCRSGREPAAVAGAAARLNATSPGEHRMSTETDGARPADPGLEALVTLLRFQGVAADHGQIRHRLGTDKIGAPEMLRCAKDLGLKARVVADQLVAARHDAACPPSPRCAMAASCCSPRPATTRSWSSRRRRPGPS